MFEDLKKKSKIIPDGKDVVEKKDAPAADKQNKSPFSKLNKDSNSNPAPDQKQQDNEPPEPNDDESLRGKNSLKLIHISDMLSQPVKANWLIENCLTESSLAFMFGNPANGKSFIALDMAFCIAHGIDWHGHPVKQGAVIYIAGEGFAGLQKRILALCLKYEIDAPDNFYISNKAIDLNSADSMNELADILPEECDIQLIVIDTLNRNCSADENSAKEMSKVVQRCDLLKDNLATSILVIHHSGHSAENRVRGSSSIKGAIDVEYMIAIKDHDITMKNTKMKDFDEFDPLSFQLQSVVVGQTDEEEPITSAILHSQAFKPEVPLCSGKEIKLLDNLNDFAASQGDSVVANDEFYDADNQPVNVDKNHRKVLRKDWFNHCLNDIEVNPKSINPDEAKRKSFDRSVKKLLNAGRIASNDESYFIISELSGQED